MSGVRPGSKNDDILARALAIAKNLPPLSPLVRHFLETISSPGEGPSLGEIAGWIEQDPLTTGKVLALANSAFYGRSVPILSVRAAVARLGLNPLRTLMLGISMNQLWSQLPAPRQWSTARFNHHSIATAVLSELLASLLAPEDTELAFLAGFFHDTGRLIIAVLLHDDVEALERMTREEHLALEDAERDLMGLSHSEISAAIVHMWNLPSSIETAVRFHENPNAEPTRWEGDRILLSDIVHAADYYVDSHGLSISGQKREEEDRDTALGQLGIGVEDAAIFSRFSDELSALLSIL